MTRRPVPLWARLPTALVMGALLALVSLVSAGLLLARWQLEAPIPYTVSLGDPIAEADGFYPIESSGGRTFRWSRPLSGVALPALAATQIVTLTVNSAREGEVPFSIFLGVSEEPVARFTAASPTWNTYTATVRPGIGADVRVIVESDSFYPGGNDPRRLGLAISELSTTPLAGSFGITYPPLLLSSLALALPLLAFSLVRRYSRARWAAALASAMLIPTWSIIVPAKAVVPGAAWIVGLTTVAAILHQSYLWNRSKEGPFKSVRTILDSRWEIPAVAGGMLLLTIVMTWPLVTHIRTALPSWPGDSFGFLYKLWWFRTALSNGQWPLFDPNSYAPFGFDLGRGEPTLMNNIPGALLAAIWNEPAAYNVLTIVSFVISGVGAYLLGKELTGSRTAGLLAGVAFAFCSYRFGQYAGHFQLLGTGWIPLLFYFTERALKTRRSRDGAFAGLMLALTALTAWYYAYMVGLLLLIYLAVRVWTARRELRLRLLVPPAIAGAAVVGVLTLPIALPQLFLYSGGELRHSAKAADSASAAPLDYLIPNPQHPLWGERGITLHQQENFLDSTLYLGGVPIGIALFGWLMMRRHGTRLTGARDLWPSWLVMGCAAFVLSLGLTLHDLRGQYQLPLAGGPITVPMPGQILFDYLPLYSSMRAYARFGVMVALAVVALMALGWGVFLQRDRFRNNGRYIGVAALLLLLADLWTAPYIWGWSRVEPTETARFLASHPPGLIMQMPLESSQSGPALWQEVYYGMPIAYGFDTFEPPQWAAVRDSLEQFPADPALDVLAEWGVRYIVVSANAYNERWESVKVGLDANSRLRHLATHPERRIWYVDPAPLDARPDMQRFALPDRLATYELVP